MSGPMAVEDPRHSGPGASRWCRSPGGAIVAAFALLTLLYAGHILWPLDGVRSGQLERDFDRMKALAFEYAARQNLLDGGLGLWSPYFGGGFPIIAHPEDASLSPLTIPSYLFGEVVGTRVQLLLALFLGAWGTYRAARDAFGVSRAGAGFAAAALMTSGWMVWRVNWGYPMHHGYLLFPWLLWGVEQAGRGKWRGFLVAVFFGFVILQQIAQGLPMFFLFVGLWALTRDVMARGQPDRWRRTLCATALPFAVALAGAFKVAGILYLMAMNDRAVPPDYFIPEVHFYTGLREWAKFILLERDDHYKNIGLGFVTATLALVGLFAGGRRAFTLVPGAFFFCWFATGSNAPIDLFGLLYRLPIFGSMHWPLKYANFFVGWTLCIFAGFAVTRLAGWLPAGARAPVYATVMAAMLVPAFVAHVPLLRRTFAQPAPVLKAPGEFRQTAGLVGSARAGNARPDEANLYWLIQQNEGTIDWDGDILLPEHATPAERIGPGGLREPVPEYRGEAYLTVAGEVGKFTLGLNRFDVTGVAAAEGRLVLNQNFDRSWRARPHAPVNHGGLLAVPVEAGEFAVTFRYRPWWFHLGATVSVLTWGGLLWRVAKHDCRRAVRPASPSDQHG